MYLKLFWEELFLEGLMDWKWGTEQILLWFLHVKKQSRTGRWEQKTETNRKHLKGSYQERERLVVEDGLEKLGRQHFYKQFKETRKNLK